MPPTSSERSRPPVPIACEIAGAERVELARDRLEPRAGGADQPHVAPPHAVGEAQPHAAEDRRAAVRPHHQQPPCASALRLSAASSRERHVVAVEEDVAAVLEGLLRHPGGVAAGHRDQHPARLGQELEGGGEAARPEFLLARGPAHLEQGVHPRQGLARRLRRSPP